MNKYQKATGFLFSILILAILTLLPSDTAMQAKAADDLVGIIESSDAGFPEMLLAAIDKKGLTDAEVYNRAHISRQLFNKLKNDSSYHPGKGTVLALICALEPEMDECSALLERAGYALSRSYMLDVIVEFFIEQGTYDIFTINKALYACDQQLLGT